MVFSIAEEEERGRSMISLVGEIDTIWNVFKIFTILIDLSGELGEGEASEVQGESVLDTKRLVSRWFWSSSLFGTKRIGVKRAVK